MFIMYAIEISAFQNRNIRNNQASAMFIEFIEKRSKAKKKEKKRKEKKVCAISELFLCLPFKMYSLLATLR